MDEAVEVLRIGIDEARIGNTDKMRAVKRLRECVPPITEERLS